MPIRPPVFRPSYAPPRAVRHPSVDEPFYRSPEWRRLRRLVLNRDGYRCVMSACGRPANTVDHIKPRREGGTDSQDNLRSVCAGCHNRLHGRRALVG